MKRFAVIVATAVTAFSTAASPSFAGGAPKCSDPGIKKFVVDYWSNKMKLLLLTTGGMFPVDFVFGILNEPIPEPYRTSWGNRSYDQLKEYAKDKKVDTKIFDAVDKSTKDVAMTLEAVRTGKNDTKSNKCFCEGDLTLSTGSKKTAYYSTQYTDDGNVYVTLLGVR